MEPEPTNLPLALEACDAGALADLLGRRGGKPLDVDGAHELLAALIELRDAEEGNGAPGDQSGLLFRSVEVGGMALFSPTLGARIALQKLDRMSFPAEWTEFAEEYMALAAGWVLAHGRDPDALASWREDSAQGLIEEWATTLTCTSHELSQIVADLMGNGYPPMDPGSPSRKKGLAKPTPPPSSSAWPKRSLAVRATTGCTRSRRPRCTGSARLLRSGPESSRRRPTPVGSVPTTPASTPASGTSESGRG